MGNLCSQPAVAGQDDGGQRRSDTPEALPSNAQAGEHKESVPKRSLSEVRTAAEQEEQEREEADQENRQSMHAVLQAKCEMGGQDPSSVHRPGDLDHLTKPSGLAPNPLRKMVHWDSAEQGGAIFEDEFEDTSEILGQGITGAVRVIKSKITGRRYARKVLRRAQFVRSRSKLEQMKREIEILKNLDHPNIVRIHKVFEHSNGDISIVMELLGGSELFERLIQTAPHYKFKEADVRRIAFRMFGALAYLHKNNLVHRDVKLENFMFTDDGPDGDLKLIDFGFSRTYLQGEAIRRLAGTPYTMAPEVFTRKATRRADVWAAGVCMFVMLYGKRPFRGRTRAEIEPRVLSGRFQWPQEKEGYEVSDVCKDLITQCLTVPIQERITAKDALKHEFFKKGIRGTPEGDAQGCIPVLTSPHATQLELATAVNRLREFREMSVLRKTVLLAVASSMTSKEISDLNRIFEELDVTNDGTIGLVELTHAIEEYSDEVNIPSLEDSKAIFEALDQDGTGIIKYSEFIAACLEQSIACQDAMLADAFMKLDLDNSGAITRDNLEELLRANTPDWGGSEDVVQETVDRMLSEGDVDGSGDISLQNLKMIMRKRTQHSDSVSTRPSFDSDMLGADSMREMPETKT